MSNWMRSMAGREGFGCDPVCVCVAACRGDGERAGSGDSSGAAVGPAGSGGLAESIGAGSLRAGGAGIVSGVAPCCETTI